MWNMFECKWLYLYAEDVFVSDDVCFILVGALDGWGLLDQDY